MKLIVPIILFTIGFGFTNAQDTLSVQYFKKGFFKETKDPSQAKRMKVKYLDEDGNTFEIGYEFPDSTIVLQKVYDEFRAPIGKWIVQEADGDLIEMIYYDPDQDSLLIEQEDSILFCECLDEASHDGATEAIVQTLRNELYYPMKALEKDISGTVTVRFTINEDGTTSDFVIFESVHPYLDIAALKTLAKLPILQPATKDGKPIKSSYTVPVSFGFQ